MLLWEICTLTIGDGTPTIQLRAATGLEIKMLSIICVNRHLKQFCNYNHTDCHSQEPNKERSIKELLEDSRDNMENV